MIKKISKFSRLQKNDLRAIKSLYDVCQHHDRHKNKLYWNILEDRRTSEFNDILFYADGILVGYLALFVFKIDEAEISGFVHPRFRQQGYFKKMLLEAYAELTQRHIKNAVVITQQQSNHLDNFINKSNAHKKISEFEMTATQPPIEKELPELTFKLATQEDIPEMAHIGSISFGSPLLEVMQRFIENANDKNRKAWLVQIGGRSIGKIHIRYEADKSVLIHDLCIIPTERGKSYASAMLRRTMEMLQLEGYKKLVLDVEAENRGALKLYEQCGFTVTAAYHFWRMETAKLRDI